MSSEGFTVFCRKVMRNSLLARTQMVSKEK